MDQETKEDAFDYQEPTVNQVCRIEGLRYACKRLRDLIEDVIPPSRERSLAITKLEEASMWSNKGVVFGPDVYP